MRLDMTRRSKGGLHTSRIIWWCLHDKRGKWSLETKESEELGEVTGEMWGRRMIWKLRLRMKEKKKDWLKDKEDKRKRDKQGDGSEKILREQETTIEGPGRGEVTEKVFQEESPRAQSTLYLLPQCAALLPPSTLQSNTQSVRMHQLKLSHRGTLNQSVCRHYVLLSPAFLAAFHFFFPPTPEIIPASQQSQHNPYFSCLVCPFSRETTVGQHQGRYLGLSTKVHLNKATSFPTRQHHRQRYAFKNTCGMPELLSIITEQVAKLLVNTEHNSQTACLSHLELNGKKETCLFLYYNSTFSTERKR